jgi:hypothetical protein
MLLPSEILGCGDQAIEDAGFVECVACVRNEMERRFGSRPVPDEPVAARHAVFSASRVTTAMSTVSHPISRGTKRLRRCLIAAKAPSQLSVDRRHPSQRGNQERTKEYDRRRIVSADYVHRCP